MTGKLVNDCVNSTAYVDKYIHYLMKSRLYLNSMGARGDAVGWGTALQARMSRVRTPMVSLEFFIDITFRLHFGPGVDSASNRNEYQEYFLGVKVAGA